jgi:hypothetical protein
MKKDKAAKVLIGTTILGLACFVGLLLNEAHHSGEKMILVLVLTLAGIGLTGVGVLGLIGIAVWSLLVGKKNE